MRIRDPSEKLQFRDPADHPLASEFEGQMIELEREYLKEGEYLGVHHPGKPRAPDDAPDGAALALVAARNAEVGQTIIL